MKLTDLDMRAYSLYCEMEGYNKITKEYYPIMALDGFIYGRHTLSEKYINNFYNLAKKEIRKEKLNELQRINIH